MAEIIQPKALNERFTLYVNANGQPVQRTLREMTADEALRCCAICARALTAN
jgi:hypothetical protein